MLLRLMFGYVFYGLAFYSLQVVSAHASPWVFPGESRTRHHIQYLADSGAIDLSATTWPMAWSDIKQAIDVVDIHELSPSQFWSVSYLRHELDKAMTPAYTQARSRTASEQTALDGFDLQHREKRELQSSITVTTQKFAGRISVTAVGNSDTGAGNSSRTSDGHVARADGSYLSWIFKDWAIGAGAIDRWWGPGWQSSTVLSNNARPAPGLFMSRYGGDQNSRSIAGRWLGKWHATTFLNKLRGGSEAIDDPLLWGARFTFTPYRSLEVGLSRTAIWGGDQQSQGLKTFKRVILNSNKEIANQLTALDIRYGFHFSGVAAAVYGQVLNQKRSASDPAVQPELALPKTTIGMAGVEISFSGDNTHHRLIAEAINTTANFYRDISQNNTAYEHPVYDQGYRYFGQSLGASTDNDSEVISLRGQHYLNNGHSFHWQWHHAAINHDDSNLDSRNAFNSDGKSATVMGLQYQLPINDRLQMTVSGQHINGRLYEQNRQIKSSVGLSLTHHW